MNVTRYCSLLKWSILAVLLLLHASSAPAQSSCQACLVVLDPHSSHAFTAGNAANVMLNNCGIRVNSDSTSAFYATGGAVVASLATQVVGGYAIVNGASVIPAPKSGTAAANDPFAGVTAPTVGSCTSHPDYTSWGTNGHYEIYPGTYCGGLAVSNGVTAHFNPGTYVISGGGIQFGSGSVSGTGVTFYITGSSFTNNQLVSINNGMTVSLTAPTSGTYRGMLFFQDWTINNTGLSSTFGGGTNMALTGSLYFPTTAVAFNNGSNSSANVAIQARTVDFEGGAGIQLNPGSAQVLPPISVTVAPSIASLYGGQTTQFTAMVANGCTSGVTWSIDPTTGAGTISAAGLYTAPAAVSAQQNVTITATSQSDGSKVGTATVTLLPPIAPVAPPAFNPPAGTYTAAQTVTISSTTAGASIRYTTDGTQPTSAVGTLYTAPIAVSANTTLNAIAYKTGMADSTAAPATYIISLPVVSAVSPTSGTAGPVGAERDDYGHVHALHGGFGGDVRQPGSDGEQHHADRCHASDRDVDDRGGGGNGCLQCDGDDRQRGGHGERFVHGDCRHSGSPIPQHRERSSRASSCRT